MTALSFGIDTTRIYFREEICELWGHGLDEADLLNDPRAATENQRRWFKRNFRDKGLKTFPVGGREAVHGSILSEWVAYNSTIQNE